MTMIDPVELSGLLDGELNPDRAQVVQAALIADPQLEVEFAALREADLAWRIAAATAGFRTELCLPRNERPTRRRLSMAAMVAIILSLVALRLMTKTEIPFAWGVAIHSVALALILGWVAGMGKCEGTVALF